jgi:hypothetical protein
MNTAIQGWMPLLRDGGKFIGDVLPAPTSTEYHISTFTTQYQAKRRNAPPTATQTPHPHYVAWTTDPDSFWIAFENRVRAMLQGVGNIQVMARGDALFHVQLESKCPHFGEVLELLSLSPQIRNEFNNSFAQKPTTKTHFTHINEQMAGLVSKLDTVSRLSTRWKIPSASESVRNNQVEACQQRSLRMLQVLHKLFPVWLLDSTYAETVVTGLGDSVNWSEAKMFVIIQK